MRTPRRAALVLLAGMPLLIAACGWQPRGAQQLAPELLTLRLVLAPADPRLEARLRRLLSLSGVTLVERAGVHTLHVTPVPAKLRNVALDRGARSAEQEMRVELVFDLRNPDGALVVGPRNLSASRVYAYDPNSVIAKLDEEKVIREELQENVLGQLLRQLARLQLPAASG
jgi:LPS-assembly lipoprotein